MVRTSPWISAVVMLRPSKSVTLKNGRCGSLMPDQATGPRLAAPVAEQRERRVNPGHLPPLLLRLGGELGTGPARRADDQDRNARHTAPRRRGRHGRPASPVHPRTHIGEGVRQIQPYVNRVVGIGDFVDEPNTE